MKNFMIRYSMAIGMLIFVVYHITEMYVAVPDRIGNPIALISIIFMLIGVTHCGWCFGKGRSPYKKNEKQ